MRILWVDTGGKGKEKKGDNTNEWVVKQLQHPKALIKSQFLWAVFFASSSSEISSLGSSSSGI